MKIFIGTDHTGYELKEKLKIYLSELGHQVEDKGAFKYDAGDDYPDFIRPVAEAVSKDKESRGIVIGGSGFGEAICANRVLGVRTLVFYGPMLPKSSVDIEGRESHDPYEIVRLSRMHNDSNMISFGLRFINEDEVKNALQIFLETPFSGDTRHIRRIQKLDSKE